MNQPEHTGPPSGLGHAEARLALGALVLGALEPAERAAVEAHVASCAACATEVADFAALPGLLGRLTAEQAAAIDPHPVDPPDELLERILARAAARRTRRHRRAISAWTAAAVAIAAATVWFVTVGPLASERPPADVVVAGWDKSTAVRGEMRMRPTPNGTEVAVALTGVEPGEQCELIAGTADGRWEVTSTWQATYLGEATVIGSTALPLADIRHLTVKTSDGRTLLALQVPQ